MSSATATNHGRGGGRVWAFIQEYSLLLIIGAVLAVVWANAHLFIPGLSDHTYHDVIDFNLLTNPFVGHLEEDGTRHLTIHYLINDVLMALFFAIAGKEVWEAVALKNGALRGRKAATPLIGTAGGMLGPIAIYLLAAYFAGKGAALANGWAIPTATDIAFSYLIGRLIFGAGHPAVAFLLLLAIADDAAGLIIIAVFYPTQELAPAWLLLSVAAALGAYILFNWLPRRLDASGDRDSQAAWTAAKLRGDPNPDAHGQRSWEGWVRINLGFWPYLAAGAISWYGFQLAGVHPALGLLPIIPAMPHAETDFGCFAAAEEKLDDTLNAFEHAMKTPVEIILFFFGLANAGVALGAFNEATYAVLAGLLIGKPLGIWLFAFFGGKIFGLPEGMRNSDLFVLGCVAAIGFTVSLFVAAVAFREAPAEILDGAKMGALISFAAAAMAFGAAWFFGVRKVPAAA